MKSVNFILDEIAVAGHLDAVENAVGIGRGYGIKCQFYFQNFAQIKKCFPEGQEQTLLSNSSQIFFGVNDNATADFISTRLGEQTIILESGGTSRSTSRNWNNGQHPSNSTGDSHSGSQNWQQQTRKLLKPEEVMALSPRTAIIFTPGVPPICTTLLRYYEEPYLKNNSARFVTTYSAVMTLIKSAILCTMLLAMAAALTPAVVRALEGQNSTPIRDQPKSKPPEGRTLRLFGGVLKEESTHV